MCFNPHVALQKECVHSTSTLPKDTISTGSQRSSACTFIQLVQAQCSISHLAKVSLKSCYPSTIKLYLFAIYPAKLNGLILNLDFDSTLCRICSDVEGRDSILERESVSDEGLEIDKSPSHEANRFGVLQASKSDSGRPKHLDRVPLTWLA